MQYQKRDRFLLFIIALILIGLPLAVGSYNHYRVQHLLPPHDRFFVLSGSAEQGWIVGRVSAWGNLLDQLEHRKMQPAVITVHKGDRVVLQLTSTDVVHGFSMKGYGIFVDKGIVPGKPVIVSFVASRTGSFPFSCNAICGKGHENMKGILHVQA